MIGEDLSFAGDETTAKVVRAQFRGTALGGVDRISVAILQRGTVAIDSAIPQPFSGILLIEGHRNVQQTNTGSKVADHLFRRLRTFFQLGQAAGGFRQLMAESVDVPAIRRRKLLA